MKPRAVPSKAWEVAPSYRPGTGITADAKPRPQRIATAEDVFNLSLDIRDSEIEHLVVFDLNVRHQIIARRIVGVGSLTGVECHPREVFRQAIANGAAAVIIMHNHPSGDPTPSKQDRELTDRLRTVGEICGIALLDHVVVASAGFVSLACEVSRC